MEPNTHSTPSPAPGAGGRSDRLASLTADVDELATEDLDTLTDVALVEETLELRRLVDCLEGQWLQRLAAIDARGAAGADQGLPAASTASWLRNRLRMGANAASSCVLTARALFRGPLTRTAQALCAGELSLAHASALAHGTHDLPAHTAAEAEPVLLDAARRLDPPRLRRVVTHLRFVADPDTAEGRAERQHQQRGLWLSPTIEGMVALDGLLEPEAGQTVLAALEPLARPASAGDDRTASQRRADGLAELARRTLEAGGLPQTGGVRPQLTVTVDLDSLLGRHPGLGGEVGGAEPLGAEACRRLACDGAVTRVLVTRHPANAHHDHGSDDGAGGHPDPTPDRHHGHDGNDDPDRHHHGLGPEESPGDHHQDDPGGGGGLAARLRAAATLLPPALGGARTQPLEVGRTSRVVTAAQRAALVVRDGGCAVAGCDRPPAWCEAHHLRHWLHGGPTDLANLALVCRAHHRAVHEGGWRLQRRPDGRLTAVPPHRRRPAAA